MNQKQTVHLESGDVDMMKKMLNSVTGPMGGAWLITCLYDMDNAGVKNAINNALFKVIHIRDAVPGFIKQRKIGLAVLHVG